jgi:phytoene dehydrogenase-like protein
VEKGRCRGVLAGRAHAEEEIQARNVITAIDLKKVFLGLLEDKEVDSGFRATLEMQEMSETYIPLYLGLRLAPATLRRRLGGSKHLYYSPAMKQPGRDPRDSEYFKDIGVGLFSSCLINPAHAPAGSSNLLALVTAPPAGWQDNWGLRDGRKTEVYAGLKHRVTGQLLEVLGTLIPELADPAAIEVCELGTPHTIERYTGNTGGSSCGFCWDLDRTFVKGAMPGKYFDRYKAIKGLHLAGHQTSYGGGIPNALLTGKSIAAKIRYRGGGRGRSAHPGRRSAPAGLGRTAPPRRASLRGRRPLRAIPAFPGGGMDHLPR